MARKTPTPEFRRSKALDAQVRAYPVRLELPPAHPKQNELINAFDARLDAAHPELGVIYDPAYPNFTDLPLAFPNLRFIAGACGTKFGKTYGCAIRLVKEAWENRGSVNWWVAPTFAQSKMAYRLVMRLLPKGTFEEYKADLKLVLLEPDGSEHSTIEFKSADNDDSLRGFAVNFFILDEAARCSEEAFHSLLTTVTQTLGRGIVISTPKGRGWFCEVYERGEKFKLLPGEKDQWPEWMSIRMPTWTNPHVPIRSIEDMRKNLPIQVFKQEVAAQFLNDNAGVFIGIDDCIKHTLTNNQGQLVFEKPIAGRRYVMGVDLAKKQDYSVITVIDPERKHVVYWDRFNHLSWDVQKHRIVEVAKLYNRASICMDSTGLGDVIVDDLRYSGIKVEPFIISNKSKQQLIDKLRVNIEFQRVTFPQINTLIKELRNYEYEIRSNGIITFSAPQGQHDDCVISLALANWLADVAPFVYRFKQVRGV